MDACTTLFCALTAAISSSRPPVWIHDNFQYQNQVTVPVSQFAYAANLVMNAPPALQALFNETTAYNEWMKKSMEWRDALVVDRFEIQQQQVDHVQQLGQMSTTLIQTMGEALGPAYEEKLDEYQNLLGKHETWRVETFMNPKLEQAVAASPYAKTLDELEAALEIVVHDRFFLEFNPVKLYFQLRQFDSLMRQVLVSASASEADTV